MDFGAKHNIGRELVKRGCNVTVVPAHTTAEQIKAMNPDGIMLSNGPGDPSDNTAIIAELKKLCENTATEELTNLQKRLKQAEFTLLHRTTAMLL